MWSVFRACLQPLNLLKFLPILVISARISSWCKGSSTSIALYQEILLVWLGQPALTYLLSCSQARNMSWNQEQGIL